MDHITSDSVKLETSWVWSTLTPQLQGHTVYHTTMQSKSGLAYSTLFLVCPLLRPKCKWLFLGIWDWCWVRWQWPATRAHHDICCSIDSGWKTGPYLIRKLVRKKRVVSVRINMVMRQELARGWNEISRGVYWYFQNGPTWQAEGHYRFCAASWLSEQTALKVCFRWPVAWMYLSSGRVADGCDRR